MRVNFYFLLISILFFGCTPKKGFYPANGECSKVKHKLLMLDIDDDHSSYSSRKSEEIALLEVGVKECYHAYRLSEKDYIAYKKLLNKIHSMDSRASHLVSSTKQLLLNSN